MSSEFTVAGRYQPNAGKSSHTLKPTAQAERSAAVSALAAAAPAVVPVTQTPAEAYAIALSKIYVNIDGIQHPFSDLQSSKKGKDGPLDKIDHDLKHVSDNSAVSSSSHHYYCPADMKELTICPQLTRLSPNIAFYNYLPSPSPSPPLPSLAPFSYRVTSLKKILR